MLVTKACGVLVKIAQGGEYQECHGQVTIAHGGQSKIKMNLNLGKEKLYLGNKAKQNYCNQEKGSIATGRILQP